MNKKLEFKDFELKKVKVLPKGISVDWFDLNQKNDLYNVDSDSQPNETFFSAMKAFNEVFAYALGLNNGWDFAREHNRKNDDILKKSINFWCQQVDDCEVTGVVYSGDKNSRGVKLVGKMKTELGDVTLTTPLIRFDEILMNCNDEEVNVGGDAQTAFDELQKEVWLFIYKNHRGGELFPAEEQESGLRVAN